MARFGSAFEAGRNVYAALRGIGIVDDHGAENGQESEAGREYDGDRGAFG